jgi:catechol 2,3-dioxygenase-like lactoylglutathione lyase family enzyme
MIAVTLLLVTGPLLADDVSPKRPAEMSLRLELFVRDLSKSVDFYTNILGFEQLEGDADYVPVRSGSVVLGLGLATGLAKQHYFNPELQTSRRGLGVEIVLEVDDVKACYDKIKATGYRGIVTPLRKRPWGATDFRLRDPDGYYLRITSR